MVFNACESARTRNPRAHIRAKVDRNMGLAESLLRGGVANYIGTYWPVGGCGGSDVRARVLHRPHPGPRRG